MSDQPQRRLQDLPPAQLEQLMKLVPADVSMDALLTVEQFLEEIGGFDNAHDALDAIDDGEYDQSEAA